MLIIFVNKIVKTLWVVIWMALGCAIFTYGAGSLWTRFCKAIVSTWSWDPVLVLYDIGTLALCLVATGILSVASMAMVAIGLATLEIMQRKVVLGGKIQ